MKYRLIFLLLLAGFLGAQGLTAENGYLVTGRVLSEESGTVYLQLVDKEAFKEQEEGYWQGTLIEVEAGKKSEIFSFSDVPAGIYSIRAFLDANGNEKMDFSIFSIEPWGTYRPVRPRFRGPRFDEIAFRIDADQSDILVEIE